MSRTGWIVAVLGGLLIGVFVYLRGEVGATTPPPKQVGVPASPAPAQSTPVTATPEPAAAATATAPTNVEQWLTDVQGGDADKRVAAIKSLASAPHEQAVPVLHRVLTDGEPTVDRPLALRSLRELALTNGDADGKVREAIRELVYHSDGQYEPLVADAQRALDDIESAESSR